jgi:hypothetical protein
MSISDGFTETKHCPVQCESETHCSCVECLNSRWGSVATCYFEKQKNARTCLFGNLENTKDSTDGVGIRFFYLLWWLDLKPTARSLCNSHLLGFFNQVAPKQKRKVPTIIAQPLSKDAEQNSIKTSCLGCRRLASTAQKAISKIILHRIISAVWLTNFLSEIRSLSNHDDETQFRILSVKPIWSFSAFDHWWSLTVQLWAVMDGE